MEDELQHYGILGMKWGIRRFQNKDGSLTKAGEKRYSDSDKEKTWSTGKKIAVGIGAGLGTAVIAAGAAYLAKKSGFSISSLGQSKQSIGKQFADEVSRDFGSIDKLISERTEKANTAYKTKLETVKNSVDNYIDKISNLYSKKAGASSISEKESMAKQLEAVRKQFDYYVKLNSESLARTKPSEGVLSAIGTFASPEAAKLVRKEFRSG